MSDEDHITKQHDQRLINHPYSMKSKAPLALPRPARSIEVGALFYNHSDRNKSRTRDRYIVTNVEGAFCNVRKFVSSQLSSTSYRIKKSECYHLPGDLSGTHSPRRPDDSSGDEEDLRVHLQFLYQLISTNQSQRKMTFPWDQVLTSLWTFPLTTPKRRCVFPLRVSTSRGVQRASVGAPHVTMIMLQT